MTLRGIISNFGLADVFSLIGSQAKTGTLRLTKRDEEIELFFVSGQLLHCVSKNRIVADLLGTILLRAEVIQEPQLKLALQEQAQSKKRLGDILVAKGAITQSDLQRFTKLQMTETVCRTFLWRTGSYEFIQDANPVVNPLWEYTPIKAESLLMEGFRQAEEWPSIRRQIIGYAMTFKVIDNLDALTPTTPVSDKSEFDLALSFGDGFDNQSPQDPRLQHIEHRERLVYNLIQAKRDVQKLIDLSQLGEFDTCKALVNLLDAKFIDVLEKKSSKPSATATVGGIHAGGFMFRPSWAFFIKTLAACVAFGCWLLLQQAGLFSTATQTVSNRAFYLDMPLEIRQGQVTEKSIHHALELYRATHGDYPENLMQLVSAQLLNAANLQFPWQQPYLYKRLEHHYTLVRPLY